MKDKQITWAEYQETLLAETGAITAIEFMGEVPDRWSTPTGITAPVMPGKQNRYRTSDGEWH